MKRPVWLLLPAVLALGAVPCTRPALAAAPAPAKVILDTDIGDDIDDAYAVALVVRSRDANLLGVTTTYGETGKRAQLAAKLLKALGRADVPVCAGKPGPAKIGRQYDWARDFSSSAVKSESAADFMRRQIEKYPNEVTLIGIGALTNIGDLVTRYPETRAKIKRIVIMGGAVYVGYGNKTTPDVEWNIRCDPAAARAVYSSGVPLAMAGLEVTAMMQLDGERQKRMFADGTPGTDAVAALTNLWGAGTPTLFDPVAVAFALGHSFSDAEQLHVEVRDDGLTEIKPGSPNVTVLVKPRKDEFLDWYVGAVGSRQLAVGKRG